MNKLTTIDLVQDQQEGGAYRLLVLALRDQYVGYDWEVVAASFPLTDEYIHRLRNGHQDAKTFLPDWTADLEALTERFRSMADLQWIEELEVVQRWI